MAEGKVINFPSSFQRSCGYYVVPSEIIMKFFRYVRGIGPDSFVVKNYEFSDETSFTSHEIMRGGMPDTKDSNQIRIVRRNQFFAEALLESHASHAYRYIRDNRHVYQIHDGNACAVYIECRGGLIGCGWYDYNCANGKKGMLLAAFMLYALASINGKTDEELRKTAYNFLPYGSEMTAVDAEKISNIIVEYLADKAIERPSPVGRFGRPVNN